MNRSRAAALRRVHRVASDHFVGAKTELLTTDLDLLLRMAEIGEGQRHEPEYDVVQRALEYVLEVGGVLTADEQQAAETVLSEITATKRRESI